MNYRGRVAGGLVVLDEGVTLPEGTIVTVIPTPVTKSSDVDDDPLYRLAEMAKSSGVPDLSLNIDHYLYGHPKTSRE